MIVGWPPSLVHSMPRSRQKGSSGLSKSQIAAEAEVNESETDARDANRSLFIAVSFVVWGWSPDKCVVERYIWIGGMPVELQTRFLVWALAGVD